MRLTASKLACQRGGRDVFADVSFSVGSGEALAIRGRNGAGKSSLLRMVIGLVRIADGRLALEGGDSELTIGEQAHYLGHQDAFKPSLSARENLQFWADFLGAGAADLDAPLAAAGLDALADLPAAYLSAGQRRRLSIARLLAVKRPIWLLDEPASALDAAALHGLTGFMAAHLAGAGIILAATHGELGLPAVHEVWLDQAPSSFVEQGRGGGWEGHARTSTSAPHLATAAPSPSAQGEGHEP